MTSGAKRIAYCSFGADSTANVLLGMEHGEPPDEYEAALKELARRMGI